MAFLKANPASGGNSLISTYALRKLSTAIPLTLSPSVQSIQPFCHAKNCPKHRKLLTEGEMRYDQSAGAHVVHGPFLLVSVP